MRPGLFRRAVRRSRLAILGAAVCVPVIVIAALGPGIAPHNPAAIVASERLLPPRPGHLLGTDHAGRDIFSRIIYGARASLEVGTVSVGLGLLCGVSLGAVAGYGGGITDSVIMRLMDGILAFPAILLALTLVALLGTGLLQIMVAIAATRIPIFARTVRALVLSERTKEYVEAARSLGQHEGAILVRHIMPNVLSPIIVLGTSYFASGIVVEASLSFLGLGIVAPEVSWGAMLNESRQYLERYPWTMGFPALALSATVLGFNLLGDGVRDILDPRMRVGL
jgi:peptide/nickel transport system permease protein